MLAYNILNVIPTLNYSLTYQNVKQYYLTEKDEIYETTVGNGGTYLSFRAFGRFLFRKRNVY